MSYEGDAPQLADAQLATLRELVSDELIRGQVRDIAGEEPQSQISQLSRHPLVLLLLGFVLTGLIANWFAQNLEQNFHKSNLQLQEANARRAAGLEAVNRLAFLIYERRVRAELLGSSLRRDASIEELKARKDHYDDSYVSWNSSLQTTYLAIREIVGAKEYSNVESYIQRGLTPHLVSIDGILTTGFDARIVGDKQWTYDSENMPKLLGAVLNCGYVITQYLWATANLYGNRGLEWSATQRNAEKELDRRCPRKN